MAERLREQVAHQYWQGTDERVFIRQRASLPATQIRRLAPPPQCDEDDTVYPQRPPSSAIRYTRQPEVYTQGNRKIVVHREPPKRRHHWILFFGLALFIMVFGWIAFGAVANWWQDKQNDWTYGIPHTFQMDQVVGINDSTSNPSHFIAMNLRGSIFIIDIEGGNPAKALSIPVIGLSAGQENDPVTISFQDVNGDGKPDMLVHVAGFSIVFLNTGKTFVGQHQ